MVRGYTVPLKTPLPCHHAGAGKAIPSKRSHVVSLRGIEKVRVLRSPLG